jgi:hypothetical protein
MGENNLERQKFIIENLRLEEDIPANFYKV